MLPNSWEDQLRETLATLSQKSLMAEPRVAIVGIGQELRGDDAAGLQVVEGLRSFAHPRLLVLNAGHAPENYMGSICRFKPDLVLLVDVAELNESAGTIRWLTWQQISGFSASTHTLPLSLLARYLIAETGCQLAIIGIQAADTRLGMPLTPAVQTAVNELIRSLSEL